MNQHHITLRLGALAIAVVATFGLFTAVVSGPQREVLLAGARPAPVTMAVAKAPLKVAMATVDARR